jgi:hypothetical protein
LRAPEVSLVGVSNRFTQTKPLLNDHFEGRAFDFAAFSWPVVLGAMQGAVQLSYQRAISFDGDRRVNDLRVSTAEEDPGVAPGTLVTDRSDVIHASGGFDILALGMGLGVTRSLRVGLTVNRWFNGYDQTLTRTAYRERQNPLREFQLDFRPRGWSYNLGVIWSPIEPLNVAAVYKTPLEADEAATLDKSRHDTWYPKLPDSEVTQNSFASEDVRLRLPASYGLGVSWRPLDRLTLSADFTRTQWSDARIVGYFDLQRTGPSSEDGVPAPRPAPTILGPLQYPTLLPVPTSTNPDDPARLNGQQDSQQMRFGVEWVLIRGAVRIPLRAGYFSDQQIERITVGDLPRFNGFTAGLGLVIGSVLLDVAYVYESSEYFVATETATGDLAPAAVSPAPRRYASSTNRVFASVIYRFSRRH